MIYLSQRDPQWANVNLGASTLKMWRWGCTTNCIAMLSDYFKCYKSPLELAKNANNYTKDGLIIWGNLKFDKMAFDRRVYKEDKADIKAALAHKDRAVILQVDNGNHWVVALRPTLWGDDYVILDPWDGTKQYAKGKYKNVTGYASFKRK